MILDFIGRLHPLILHLPIGAIAIAFLMAVYSRFKKKEGFNKPIGFTLAIGAISAIFAAITGFLLSQGNAYEGSLVNNHKWLGIATTVVAIAMFFLHRAKNQSLFFPIFIVLMSLLAITGHMGGSLTHGETYLTDPLFPTYDYTEDVLDLEVPAASASDLNTIKTAGFSIDPISEEKNLLEVKRNGENISKKELRLLRKIAPQMISLDLSQTDLNDDMAASLSDFIHLQKLHIQNTKTTGVGLNNLADLRYLEYINLYKTSLNDDGLAALQELKNLKQIFIWQTDVSDAAINDLINANQNLSIDRGADRDIFGKGKLIAPMISAPKDIFTDTMLVSFKSNFDAVQIFYTTDNTTPDSTSNLYDAAFVIDQSAHLRAVSYLDDWEHSEETEKILTKAKYQPVAVTLKQGPHKNYPANGAKSLTDFEKGTSNFREGTFWLGYEGAHMTATLDMGEVVDISNVIVSALEETGSYIFFPKQIIVSTSEDGKAYKEVQRESYPVAQATDPPSIKQFSLPVENTQAQYVKVDVRSRLKNPSWHPAPGSNCWLFVDEIIVE